MLRKIKQLPGAGHQLLIKDLLLCFFSAILFSLPFINGKLWIFAWCGFVPLFFALEGKSRLKAFFLAYLTGIIFWAGTIYWLVHVTLLGTIFLIFYLALYFAIFGIFITYNTKHKICGNYLLIPSFWVILEYIRSYLFTGFPWALAGYSQYLNLPIIQISALTGAWGVSFLVIMGNLAVYSSLKKIPKTKSITVFFILIVLTLGYGYYKLYSLPRASSVLKISLIQANIPQELKWQEKTKNYIFDRYEALSKKAAEGRPDLIVWPEAASPGLLGQDEGVLSRLIELSIGIKFPLLIGAVTNIDDQYFNSALLFEKGNLLDHYNKLHLVPFGEYIPLKNALPFLETIVPIGDITRGKDYTIFEIKNGDSGFKRQESRRFGVLICFEDVFPELSRKFVNSGAEFLVNITNDAWYKETTAPYQHLQASVFRAVENHLPLVRAANTGITAFIAPSGKIISRVADKSGKDIFVSGILTQDIYLSEKNGSIYTKSGDIFVFLCFAVFILGLFSTLNRKK